MRTSGVAAVLLLSYYAKHTLVSIRANLLKRLVPARGFEPLTP